MRRISLVIACCALVCGLLYGAIAGPPAKEKVITTKSGLKYVDIKIGKGASPEGRPDAHGELQGHTDEWQCF